jgi:hypothetical protein
MHDQSKILAYFTQLLASPCNANYLFDQKCQLPTLKLISNVPTSCGKNFGHSNKQLHYNKDSFNIKR